MAYESVKELGPSAKDLKKKTVAVIGLGAIGSTVADMLARMGISLRIIDKDRVYEQDIEKLSLFDTSYISKFKAKEAKKILEDTNKDIKVKAFHEELVKNNAYLVEADVIIDCSNNMNTALLVDAAAKKRPVIYARAGGAQGCVIITSDTRIRQMQGFLEKNTPVGKHVLPTTARLIASLAVNKALKVLTGQKYEKNLLLVDGWKFSVEKVTVRKDKK